MRDTDFEPTITIRGHEIFVAARISRRLPRPRRAETIQIVSSISSSGPEGGSAMRRYVHQPCEGFCLIVAVVCLLLSPLASAETIHPNIDRGFKADKTYDVLGLD